MRHYCGGVGHMDEALLWCVGHIYNALLCVWVTYIRHYCVCGSHI